jgi:hypothetical protein
MSKWQMPSFRGAGSSPRARNPYSHAVVMDSGLAALRRSGMTAALAIALVLAGPAAAQDRDRSMATVAEIPLTGDDGQVVPNHAVKINCPAW